MKKLWGLDNFSGGMFTQPAKTENGDNYAFSVENLLADKEGYLSLSPELREVVGGTDALSGAAATDDYVFVLRSDGSLYILSQADLTIETEVDGIENMEGRLSVVSPFGNYAILTSEGEDQGYWIDLRDLDLSEPVQAHTLGIDKPTSSDWTATKYPSDTLVSDTDDADLVALGPNIFVAYAISYVRDFPTLLSAPDDIPLFNGMESELSDPVGFIFKRLDFKNDNFGPSTASTYQMATFDFSRIDAILSEQVTGINIYRSAVLRSNEQAEAFDELTDRFLNDSPNLDLSKLLYRKIAYIPKSRLNMHFTDGIFAVKGDNEDQIINSGDAIDDITGYRTYYHTIDFDPTNFTGVIAQPPPAAGIKTDYPWYVDVLQALGIEGVTVSVYGEGGFQGIAPDRPPFLIPVEEENAVVFYKWQDMSLFEPGNLRMPSTATFIIYVGGRIYAACGDEVRFSDIRGISFDLWRFPDNLVPPETDRVDFVASFTDVLLFGARDAMYRIDLDHTNIDRLSDRGPLDPFSIAQTARGLSFISSDGIYATDGVEVVNVVDLALDDEFRDFRPLTGNVTSLGEYGAIFQAKGTDIKVFLFHDRAFWKLKIDPSQFVSFVRFNREFFVAEGTALKAIRTFDVNQDEDQAWSWQSQEFDFGTRFNKAFTELRLQTSGGVAVELTAVCDGREKVIEFDTVDRFQPQRIRINMRGRRLQFSISGMGTITIRNIEIWGRIIER